MYAQTVYVPAKTPLALHKERRYLESPASSIQRPSMTISAVNVRNQFRGKVKEIIEGPVVSEIDVETPSGLIVTSVITTRSVKDLDLVVGKEVIALVKSTEVAIAAL
jgi:molybdopterin-binding protein